MTHTTSRTLIVGILVAVASGASLLGRTEQAAPASDVLPALLTEVRGLRAAMEQMASAGPRVQLGLGRLQLVEQRITTLSRRLDDVRASLAQSRKEFGPVDRLVKEMEESLRRDSDPDIQRTRGNEIRDRKAELARIGAELQRLSADETFLMQEISGEQARWSDVNQRLEDLERTLERR